MHTNEDLFPTRTETKLEPFERLDPVIYSDDTTRAEGPLSAELLAQYERDGYLRLGANRDTRPLAAAVDWIEIATPNE